MNEYGQYLIEIENQIAIRKLGLTLFAFQPISPNKQGL